MTGWTIYWFTRLDGIIISFGIIGFVSLIISIIEYIIYRVKTESICKNSIEATKSWKKILKLMVLITIMSYTIVLFCPSSKEFAAIYLIPKIVNNKKVQQIPDKALTILNSKLDKWIQDQTNISKNK